MVWNTTQSALYKAVDAFNSGEIPGADINPNRYREPNQEHNHEHNREPDIPPDNRTQAPRQNCCPDCPARQNPPPAPLSRLFSDNDMLLIAGLILILSRQNADRKLILALAFVLLT